VEEIAVFGLDLRPVLILDHDLFGVPRKTLLEPGRGEAELGYVFTIVTQRRLT
jgi:hypothetical protein